MGFVASRVVARVSDNTAGSARAGAGAARAARASPREACECSPTQLTLVSKLWKLVTHIRVGR